MVAEKKLTNLPAKKQITTNGFTYRRIPLTTAAFLLEAGNGLLKKIFLNAYMNASKS
jgi:hypothetical protein